jgi:hypothetical protein
MVQHEKTWWYRLAERWVPERCREVPEARNPERLVLRQVALVRRYAYLQQFASGEDESYCHSHQWRWLLVFVLWGSYLEYRLVGDRVRLRRAPAAYLMGPDCIHRVNWPSRGHTSLAIGFWRDEAARQYFPVYAGKPWRQHVKQLVKRI